jgi:entry exclusion lipoprotein TrbK
MRPHQYSIALVVSLLLMSLPGCNSAEPDGYLPEVNEKNCTSDLASKIANKTQRNRFIDLCARRNAFKPSPPRTW